MSQEELMAKTIEAVRNDGFTVSDNYLKGEDWPYSGGYMITTMGEGIGSLRYQGGGVIFNSDVAEYFVTDAEEIPLLVNRVVQTVEYVGEEEEIDFFTCCGQDLPVSENCGHGFCSDHRWDCPVCGEEATDMEDGYENDPVHGKHKNL